METDEHLPINGWVPIQAEILGHVAAAFLMNGGH